MKVLCFGSLNIDYTYKVHHFVGKGETLSSETLSMFSGGKGLNQSIALAKAGAATYHAGAIGTDGEFLLRQLQEAGVNTDYVTILDNIKTGHAIIQNDKDGDNCILLYGGANQEITEEQILQVLERFECGDFIVLQNEINKLPEIMEFAHKKGMKIVLNPSPMNEKIEQLPLEYVDYFLLNEVEAKQILKQPADGELEGEKLAEALYRSFPQAAVLLTMGESGAIYMDKNQKLFQSAYKVRAVDTTAAGDTFTGFFIGGILKELTVEKAMDMAAKASAIAVTRQGAAPSIPSLKETESFKGE